MKQHRAAVFVDGENWSKSVRKEFGTALHDVDHRSLFEALVQHRTLSLVRWYSSRRTDNEAEEYRKRFCQTLQSTDPRITIREGRTLRRSITVPEALELNRYLGELAHPDSRVKLDKQVYHRLKGIGSKLKKLQIPVEKEVDVMLALDFVRLADLNLYDSAYLLSADGDFVPVIEAVRDTQRSDGTRRDVYVVSPRNASALARVATNFIPLNRAWISPFLKLASKKFPRSIA